MGRIISVKHRGEDVDVEIDHDGGYEHDTNAHEIEWHFVEEPSGPESTPEEEQAIYDQLCSLEPEYFDDDF